MGVTGLWRYLHEKYRDILSNLCQGDLNKKKLGLDVSIFMHIYLNSADDPNSLPLEGFLIQIENIQKCGAIPIYLFDGCRNPIKAAEHARRADQHEAQKEAQSQRLAAIERLEKLDPKTTDQALIVQTLGNNVPRDVKNMAASNMVATLNGFEGIVEEVHVDQLISDLMNKNDNVKEKVHIPDEFYHELMDALDERGIRYIIGKTEAEKLGADLVRRGEIDILVTNDGDAMPFGSPNVLRNFFQPGDRGMQFLKLDDVLTKFGLSYAQFVDVCIICGCDFTEEKGIPGIGIVNAIKIIKKHGSLQNYFQSTDWVTKEAKLKNAGKTEFSLERFDHETASKFFMDTTCQIAFDSCNKEGAKRPKRIRQPSVCDDPLKKPKF